MGGIGLLWVLSLPGLVCLLVVLVALERFGLWAKGRSWLPWRRRDPRNMPVSATGFEEVDAFFTGAKRIELEQRQSESMMRDDQEDGAPPRPIVDLDAGVVTFNAPRREG